MDDERIRVPLAGGPLESTSALWSPPAEPRANGAAAVLLAHGAGFHMEAPFMRAVAEGLAARGFGVLRFDYPYKERERQEGRRRPPDRQPVLEAAHEAAAAVLGELAPDSRALFAGKSLGGRMASHLAARDVPCAGLVFLGFPLHAPGKPGTARAEHFAAIAQPALFLQGTRDSLCDLELLREAIRRWGGTATVEVIEGADHGFHVPKRSGRTDDEVLEGMLERIDRWDAETFPA